MKLSRLIVGAVLVAMLSACSATSALSGVASLVSPDKPEITAQVGKTNTKQGIGATVSKEKKTSVGDVSGNAKVDAAEQADDSVTVKDITGGHVNASKQGQKVDTGNVQAKTVNVVTNDTTALLISYGLGLTTVLGLVMWFVPSPRLRAKKEAVDGEPKADGVS